MENKANFINHLQSYKYNSEDNYKNLLVGKTIEGVTITDVALTTLGPTYGYESDEPLYNLHLKQGNKTDVQSLDQPKMNAFLYKVLTDDDIKITLKEKIFGTNHFGSKNKLNVVLRDIKYLNYLRR
jgi:hypothetical protein